MNKFVNYPPMCASRGELNGWKKAAKLCGGLTLRAGFCTDCTPDFKRKSMANSVCNNPHIVFSVDEDGFVEGRVPRASPEVEGCLD